MLKSAFFARIFVFAFFTAVLAACGGSDSVTSRVMNVASDEADFIAVGNISRAFDQMGIKVDDGHIELPRYIKNLFDRSYNSNSSKVEENIENLRGIDFNSVAVCGKVKGSDVDFVMAFGVSNANDLYDFLNETDARVDMGNEGDYITIGDRQGQILIQKNDAYVVYEDGRMLGGRKAVVALERWLEKAKSQPLDGWKIDYLNAQAVAAYWMSSKMAVYGMSSREKQEIISKIGIIPGVSFDDLSLGVRLDLDGNKAKLNLTVFNDGKIMEFPYEERFNTDLLNYAGADDMLVVGAAISNSGMNLLRIAVNNQIDEQIESYTQDLRYSMDEYDADYSRRSIAETEAFRTLINNTIDNMEGSMMLAMGPDDANLKEFVYRPDNHMHFVLAMDFKNGKARPVAKLLTDFFKEHDSHARVNSTSSGYEVTIRSQKIYIDILGNHLVVSNRPVTQGYNNGIDKDVFSDTWLAAQIFVSADQTLIRNYDLPFGINLSATAHGVSADAEVSFPDSKENFVPTLVGIIEAMSR